MKKKLKKWWDSFKEAVHEACVMYNASADIEEGRDPRESLQYSKTLDDVPNEVKRPQ